MHSDADPHWAPTRLVALEDTHNHCGGLVYPLERILAVRRFCDRNGLLLHLDGARIWNAHVASGVPLAEIAAPCDTVSVCLSKGLGAPVGSLVLCGAELLPRLIRARKLLGGGMRQAGILAAAGLYALEHNIGRMAEDHRRARRWPNGWHGCRACTSTWTRSRPTWSTPTRATRERPPPTWSGISRRQASGAWTKARGPSAWSPTSTWTTPTSRKPAN